MKERPWEDLVLDARATLSKAYDMGAEDVRQSTVVPQRELLDRCARLLELIAPIDRLSDDLRAERRALLAEIEAGR